MAVPRAPMKDELLLVSYRVSEKSGACIGFTTKQMLDGLDEAARVGAHLKSPLFAHDTRYGQITDNMGICAGGVVELNS